MGDATTTRSTRSLALVAAGLFVLAFVPRLLLFGQSLFGDELWSYDVLNRGSLVDVYHGIDEVESTPPAWHALAWLGTQVSDSVVAIRWPSLLFGSLAAVLVFDLGRRVFCFPAGLFAAVAVAIDPFLVFYGSEARAYALASFFVLLAALSLARYAEARSDRWFAWFALSSAAAVMSHYLTALPLAAIGLWALIALPRDRLKMIGAGAFAAAFVGLWLAAVGGGPAPRIVAAFYPTTFENVREAVIKVMGGLPFTPPGRVPGTVLGVLLFAALAVAAVGLVLRVRDRVATLTEPAGMVIAAAVVPPVLLLGAAVVGSDLWAPRNLLPIVPFVWLALGAGW